MADTYTQLYIHIVFSVKGRQALIPKQHKEELHKYIAGIITNKKHKLIQINSMPDHIHILIGMNPNAALSGLVKDIKVNSTRFINQKRWTVGQFSWQTGYGAFSYSHSQIPQVATYIENQEAHHSHQTFRDEYLAFLDRYGIAYDLNMFLIRLQIPHLKNKHSSHYSIYIALLWSAAYFNTFFLQTYHASGVRMCNLRGRINTDA